MSNNLLRNGLGMFCLGVALTAAAQVEVDYTKYPDYSPVLNPEAALAVHPVSQKKSRGVTASVLPDHVNNAETIYFPPVFNQAGGSCGSASRISYMFNWEMNAYRGLDGSVLANQYPSHFTWLLTDQGSGKEGMAATIGIPNVPTYGGRTYSSLFGNQDCGDEDYGWMTGYDKWYSAMQNRISYSSNMPNSLEKEQGREDFKWWLYNHNGDEDFYAGGIGGIGVASGGTWVNIPSTATNDEIGVTGKKYVKAWGKTVDHALTIVGYDDRIEFDLDGDGVYGEKDEDEVGAWIIVNSWGSSWCNNGFIYCPYKYATPTATSTSYWKPEIYHYRKNYRPLRVLKVKMEYNHRARMRLSAGISQDVNATSPEQTTLFDHFKYAGNGDVPMLGRWADGKLHSEPMEFGYDLTDLTSGFDRTKPLKYFFIIETKATDTLGSGKVHELSLMDYEYDTNGIETPFSSVTSEGVDVPGFGKKTVITMIVNGESLNAPTNLVYNDGTLSWEAPARGSGEVVGYNLYHNGTKQNAETITATSFALSGVASGTYQVSAVYNFGGIEQESDKSNTALLPVAATTSTAKSLRFMNGGFTIPNVFKNHYDEATIEFQIRPTSLSDNSQKIGIGWGDFMVCLMSSGAIKAGWDNTSSNCVTSSASAAKASIWTNVSLVIRQNSLTVYANGKEVGNVVSGTYSGIGGYDSLYVGLPTTGLSCTLDEFRFWNKARTADQIKKYYTSEFANPTSQDGLLAYYKMDRDTIDGVVYLKDAVAGNDAPVWGRVYNAAITPVKTLAAPTAAFTLPSAPYCAMSPIQITDASSANAVSWSWNIQDAVNATPTTPNPVVKFQSAGKKAITLTVADAAGNTATATDTITVQEAGKPVSKFHATKTSTPAGDRISLINDSLQTDCSYEWLMPGAEIERATTTNTSAIYDKVGVYTVTLRVTNAAGDVAESTQNISVESVAPEADFEISPRTVIKGETTYLTDKSKYEPTEWQWTLTSDKHSMVVLGQHSSLKPTIPGVYDVTLKATNALGSSSVTSEKALVVCNANSENGLNFSGGSQSISLSGPFASSSSVTKFTVEYWLRPTSLSSPCNYIGSSSTTFQMTTNASGAVTVNVKGKSATSLTGYVLTGAWHHYAVQFSMGTVSFYRDGVLFDKVAVSGANYTTAWTNGVRIGGSSGPINGMIDEFRIWGTALSLAKIKKYANAPIDDVSSVSSDKLLVYYRFNQNSGNCEDASGNGYTGTRENFGPDGDAWSESKGVFCLNFESAEAKDVTATYLKNYKTQFSHNGVNVIEGGSGKYELTDWTVTGAVTSGKITSKPHVNTSKNYAMTMESGWSSFPSVSNCAVFQTIELPEGAYTLTVAAQEGLTSGCYLVAAEGDTIPNVDQLESDALGYASLTGKTMTFVVPETSKVSLGVLFRMSGTSSTSIKSFTLTRSDIEVVKADMVNSISNATTGGKLTVKVERGGVYVSGAGDQQVKIYSTDGVLLFNKRIKAAERINLPKGIYIVNGSKVAVE